MLDNEKTEEKLINLALLFCTLLIFILYLLNHSELSAKSNLGLNLLSNPSIKQTKINSAKESDFRHKMIIGKSTIKDSRQLKIKPSILWQPPSARYVLYEMNKTLNQEREEKVLEHLTQIELRRNAHLSRAFKIYNAASLKQFFYLIGGFFNNAQISNSRGAYEYISKIRQEQLKLVKEYLSFFSSDLNFRDIDTAHEKEVIETISGKYSFQTLNYINHLYSRFPYYYETKNKLSLLQIHENDENTEIVVPLHTNFEGDESLKNGVVHQFIPKNHSPELCLSHGRILLISLDSLEIGTFLISDESLVKVYKLNTGILAVQALSETGTAELIINTKQGLLHFNLNIGKSHSADFNLLEKNKLKILPSHTVSVNSLITIKLNSRIEGSILASNGALLEFKHLVNSQDKEFLRIFLLKIKNTVGITDIVVCTEKLVYKFTLEVSENALRSEIDEIFLD